MEQREAFYVSLGQKIRALRDAKKLTQQQLGQRLAPPVTRASIANIETGTQRVLAHTLVDLARALEVPPSELLPEAVTTESAAAEALGVSKELEKKLNLSDTNMKELKKQLRLGDT